MNDADAILKIVAEMRELGDRLDGHSFRLPWAQEGDQVIATGDDDATVAKCEGDRRLAIFIVAARTNLPRLCDALERLTGAMLAINNRHKGDINDAIVTGFYAARRILEGTK